MYLGEFLDDVYPFNGFAYFRETARGVVCDEKGRIALNLVKRNDIFGEEEYYELPGGGIKGNEAPMDALKREIEEELGFKVDDIKEVGVVDSSYNLIGQKNRNYYFLCNISSPAKKVHYESKGDLLIAKTVFVTLLEGLELLKGQLDGKLGKVVARREIPVLERCLGLF